MGSLSDRGITEATLNYFGIEPHAYKGMDGWRYPVPNDQGQIVGWRWKNADSMATPKYLWLTGDRPPLYNLIAVYDSAPSIWIVNGEPAVWAMHSAGIPAVCWFGEGNIPDNLPDLLQPFSTVFYAPDHDTAGYKAALKVHAVLGDKVQFFDLAPFDKPHYDMGDVWRDGHNLNTLKPLTLKTIELRTQQAKKLPPPPSRDKRLNPLVGQALLQHATAHGKINPDGTIGILSPDPHSRDEPGKHCTYYPNQMQAWEFGKDRWISAKELCHHWGIDYERLGGIYEAPAKNGKSKPKVDTTVFLEAEGAVLACLFQQESHWSGLTLTPQDLSMPAYRHILAAMLELRETMTDINAVTLKATLQQRGVFEDCGGDHILRDLATFKDTAKIKPYLDIVREASLKRQLQGLLFEAANALNTANTKSLDVIDMLSAKIENYRGFVADSSHLTTLAQAALDNVDAITDDLESGANHRYMKTGLTPFDDLVGGLFRGKSYIGIALSGIGKSNFLGTVAAQLAMDGRRGLVFSLEMSAEELAQRFIAQQSGVSEFKQSTRHFTAHADNEYDEFQQVSRAAYQIATWGQNLMIYDHPIMNAKTLREVAYSVHKQTPLDFIGFDYIQLAQIESESLKAQTYDELSYTLKCLARELNVAAIGLSQVNREGEKGADKPMASHVKDSGGIINHANVAFFIYRPGVFNPKVPAGETIITVTKNRGGRIGTCNLWFDGARSRFYSEKPPVQTWQNNRLWGDK